MLTRRKLIAGLPLLGCAAPGWSFAPDSYKVLRQFKNSSFLSQSPDGSLFCLCKSKNFIRSYRFDGLRWLRGAQKPEQPTLQIVDANSVKIIWEHKLYEVPLGAAFWSNDALYAETLDFQREGKRVHQRLQVDIRSGKVVEKFDDGPFSEPAGEGRLLRQFGPRGSASLQVVSWPEDAILVEAPVHPQGLAYELGPNLKVSPNLDMLVHSVDDLVIARRTGDLSVIWTRRVEPGALGAYYFQFSGDGTRLAVVTPDSVMLRGERRKGLCYVGILSAADGSGISKFNFDHIPGASLNHDGSQLAIQDIVAFRGDNDVGFAVRDVASGNVVMKIVHDAVPPGRLQYLQTWGSLHFGRDQDQFLTAGGRDRVKVWRRVSRR